MWAAPKGTSVSAAYTAEALAIARVYWLRLNATLSGATPLRTSSTSSAQTCARRASQSGPVMMSARVKGPENVYSRKSSPRQMRAGSHSPAKTPTTRRAVMASPSADHGCRPALSNDVTAAAAPPRITTAT